MRQAVAESIVPFDLRHEDDSFSCEIRTADIGVVRIVEIDAPTSEAVRTRRLIRRSDREVCTIHLQLRGHPVVEQDDRQVQVCPGALPFVALSRPTWVAGAAHRQVSVMFPRALLPLSREKTRRLAGVSISGRDGTGALVGRLVRAPVQNRGGLHPRTQVGTLSPRPRRPRPRLHPRTGHRAALGVPGPGQAQSAVQRCIWCHARRVSAVVHLRTTTVPAATTHRPMLCVNTDPVSNSDERADSEVELLPVDRTWWSWSGAHGGLLAALCA